MLRLALAVAVTLVAAAPAPGHPDDPKEQDKSPVYRGPGYRASALAGLPAGAFDALNVTLQSWVPLSEFEPFGLFSSGANDCWGYTSPSGREYAILGFREATGFIEITDPADAQIVDVIPALTSTWRDIKTYDEYAYVVTEASGGGIQVVDLTQIDAGVVTLCQTSLAGTSTRNHNVALDPVAGRLYGCGGGTGLGFRVFDLTADPADPVYLGEWNTRYVHDLQVHTMTTGPDAGKQIAFACGGFNSGSVETGLDILDVTDPANIMQRGRLVYPNGAYSHQAWLSDDEQLIYLNDELDEGGGVPTTTIVIDVSDLDAPVPHTTFTNGNTAVGHNLYVRGNLVFEANYASGLRVFDVTNPLAATEVAYFDTRPEDDAVGFPGMWSNYPFFPSGTVIGSDRQRGLFVFTLDLGPAGDANGDGLVDFADVLLILSSWGPCFPTCPADLDHDGVVAFPDLLIALTNWS